MHKYLYSIYDTVSQSCVGPIFQDLSDAPAIRAFHDALRDTASILHQHPHDYQLILIGTIDTNTGRLDQVFDVPPAVATGSAWLEAITTSTETQKNA